MTYSEFYDQVCYDPIHHVSSDTIKALLKAGIDIESCVLGRFGYVSEVYDDGVVILKTTRSKRSKSKVATTFQHGDPVEIEVIDETHVLLRNPAWVIDGMFRGNEEMEYYPHKESN